MIKNWLMILVVSVFLSGCWQSQEPEPVVTATLEPEVQEPERPNFAAVIDDEDAFEKALEAVPVEQVPQFVEVIDEGNADEIVSAAELEMSAAEAAAQAAAAAAHERKVKAAQARLASNTKSGLDFRVYSSELYSQVLGSQAAILFFTAADCAACEVWEETLRAEATAFAEKNALIIKADLATNADLAAEMKVTKAGQGIMITGIGEIIGPRGTERLTTEDLLFIFP